MISNLCHWQLHSLAVAQPEPEVAVPAEWHWQCDKLAVAGTLALPVAHSGWPAVTVPQAEPECPPTRRSQGSQRAELQVAPLAGQATGIQA